MTAQRLTDVELSAEFYRAALDLHSAPIGGKVDAARRYLTVQRFALAPCYDQEH